MFLLSWWSEGGIAAWISRLTAGVADNFCVVPIHFVGLHSMLDGFSIVKLYCSNHPAFVLLTMAHPILNHLG